jgi:V/A-type H+-transporting ATPase subunit C
MWELVLSVVPDGNEFSFLLIENDFHNLKTAIKAAVSNKNSDGIFLFPSVCTAEQITDAVKSKKFTSLPKYMSAAAEKAYKIITETGDGQLSDAVLDRAYAQAVKELTENGGEFIKGLGELIAADCCMRTAVRCAKMHKDEQFVSLALCECDTLNRQQLVAASLKGVEAVQAYLLKTNYEKQAKAINESISEFERQCENMLLEYCYKAKYTALGPAPVAAYIIRKKAQIKTARIVVSCKTAGLSEQLVRQRIRNTV